MSIPLAMSPVGYDTWVTELKRALITYLGSFQLVVDYLPDEKKLIVHTDRVSDETYAEVATIAAEYIPSGVTLVQYNHDISIPWQEIPEGFTVVEYLASTNNQWISIPISGTSRDDILLEMSLPDVSPGKWGQSLNIGNSMGYDFAEMAHMKSTAESGTNAMGWRFDPLNTAYPRPSVYQWYTNIPADTRHIIEWRGKDRYIYFDGELKAKVDQARTLPDCTTSSFRMFFSGWGENAVSIYRASYTLETGEVIVNVIPCLDTTGTPCMVNRVTRTPYYNRGSGNFLYPGSEAAATTNA